MTSSLSSLDKMTSPAAMLFAANRVEKTISDVLDAYLHNVRYEPNRCSQLSHNLCTIIKEQTKKLHRSIAADRRRVAVVAMDRRIGSETIDRPSTSVVTHDDGDDDDADDIRWKLVVHVVLGQDSDQSVLLSSRCIWNADTDCLASATYRNNSLFAVATVYGLRCDEAPSTRVDRDTRLRTD